MKLQQSFKEQVKGTLYLVPTPIGNLEDMTFRALRMLKEADIIAAEDTRQTKKLCNYYEITTPVVSYHEHNKETSGEKLIQLLEEGKVIALVSDAGMPTISDPGYELVIQALEHDLNVVPLPGANAALTSLIASGLPTQPFYFYGFLDRQKKERRKQLDYLKMIKETMIFYESPHRLKETLADMEAALGNRRVVLSRELTKKFEEFFRGTVAEAIAWLVEHDPRGEYCVIVEGALESDVHEVEAWWTELSIRDHVNVYIEEKQLPSKEAIKQAAIDRGLPKREVYQAYHVD